MYLARVLLFACLPVVAAQHPAPKPSSQPAEKSRNALHFTPWRTRVAVAVYQVTVSSDRVHEIDRDKLEQAAGTLRELSKALKELGETRLVNLTDQMIGNDTRQEIQLGASRPTPSGSQSFKGQTSTQVEYQDTGCNFEITSHWNPDDPAQGMLDLGVEVSSVLESKIQLSPKSFAPIIYQMKQRFLGPVVSGKPVVLLSVDGNNPETDLSVYVTRAVIYHTNINEARQDAAP